MAMLTKGTVGVGNRPTWQITLALALATGSDLLDLAPMFAWVADILTAITLSLLFNGRKKIILPILLLEVIPGLSLFPSWMAVVGGLLGWEHFSREQKAAAFSERDFG